MEKVKNMTLFEVASEIDCDITSFQQVRSAFEMLDECMENEGFQRNDCPIDEMRAIHFVRRFPMYLSAYRAICRSFDSVVAELQEFAELLFEASNTKEETTT